MRVMGIDYGSKRVGVALSDPMQIIATPLTIINHDDNDELIITELLTLIKSNDVTKLVVGLPLNMNGSIGFQAERVQLFVERLKQDCNLPIIFEDERESSKQVKEIMKKIKSKDERIDDKAAAIILKNYLDYN